MTPPNPFSIISADWNSDRDRLLAVRYEVFVEEQKVPAEIEVDDLDPLSAHVLALDSADTPVGTARLVPGGRIGRVAVLKEWRGKGVGAALMNKLIAIAEEDPALDELMLHAQTWTVGFYESLGFVVEGEEFEEADIPHVTMKRKFSAGYK